ncbi:MAG: HAMP domain-containing histidine kinase [Desulfamplus sp.]|nr:HAMP domain-containing histidine kinase [Desulfamplus sp.]
MGGQIEGLNKLDLEGKGLQSYDLQYSGLQYFGAMSASIAHEIKNALAITNENAGLLEDLSLISIKNGQPLDSERVARLSRKVMEQIKRADTIVKKMSQFAHSVDDPVKVVSLSEVVELTLELGRRTASTKSITLAPVSCDFPISIETNPFLLMNLLWIVIKSAFKRVNSDKKIEIALSKEDKQAKIIIKHLVFYNIMTCQENIGSPDLEQEKRIIHLADWLNAKIDMNNEDKIIITISPIKQITKSTIAN